MSGCRGFGFPPVCALEFQVSVRLTGRGRGGRGRVGVAGAGSPGKAFAVPSAESHRCRRQCRSPTATHRVGGGARCASGRGQVCGVGGAAQTITQWQPLWSWSRRLGSGDGGHSCSWNFLEGQEHTGGGARVSPCHSQPGSLTLPPNHPRISLAKTLFSPSAP